MDDCDAALSLAGAAQLGAKWACANKTEQVLPERCALLTETCHRYTINYIFLFVNNIKYINFFDKYYF